MVKRFEWIKGIVSTFIQRQQYKKVDDSGEFFLEIKQNQNVFLNHRTHKHTVTF